MTILGSPTLFASPQVPVSWGELLDKITILEIKRERIGRADALANVVKEHRALSRIGARALRLEPVATLCAALRRVNEELWEIEDAIRAEEARADFGATFIRLARSVYRKNDERAALKREINALLNSELVEEKSYWDGAPQPQAASARRHVQRDEPRAFPA